MTDPQKPALTEGLEPSVDAAVPEDPTLQPGEAVVNPPENSSDQTIPPLDSAGTDGGPVDRTIPPSSGVSAETSADVAHDQTLQPGGGAAPAHELDSNRFGDYEILQEIARGGMGVVYKARQISLNRTVALKKILSGQLAGEEDLKRFQVEAEASAQLDHVGIVPVYDFGQVDGQYFFSMGFVEGDDLAERIRERPLEAEAAAEMMIKIAQAVGYANAKGVIHRDLKPSNVLLDAQNEPKVTDFGVAKQQGNDSELTAQGQILGTPSYMPPEQAAGQGDAVDQRHALFLAAFLELRQDVVPRHFGRDQVRVGPGRHLFRQRRQLALNAGQDLFPVRLAPDQDDFEAGHKRFRHLRFFRKQTQFFLADKPDLNLKVYTKTLLD